MGIRYIKEIKSAREIDVLIPAAGLGRRMKSYGPKPLIEIGNTNILQHQLSILKRCEHISIKNTILVCGFEANKLMNNSPEDIIKIENENYMTTNVVRSIGMGLRATTQEVLIIYGDLIFNVACIDAINLNRSCLVVGDTMTDEEVGCIVNKRDYVENLMYDLPTKWCQIAFFAGKELKLLKKHCWNSLHFNFLGFEIINKIIEDGGKFKACTNNNVKAIDIDTFKDLDRVRTIQ